MGVFRMFSDDFIESESESTSRCLNPDPANFEILKVEQIGRFLIVKVHYPDCINFEGMKIHVYENLTEEALWSETWLDPHFRTEGIAPIARFVPTEQGWQYAVAFCLSV